MQFRSDRPKFKCLRSGFPDVVWKKSTSTKKISSPQVLQFRSDRPKLYHIMSNLLVYLCNLSRTDLNCSACDVDFLSRPVKIHKYTENLEHSSLAV